MEYIKNDESKIKYICLICSKNFNNRKSDYERHINKKNGCNIDLIKKWKK